AAGIGAAVELGVEIGFGEAVEGEAEVGRLHLVREAQRVEVGGEVAARTVGGQQAQYSGLLARVLVADRRGRHDVALLLCRLDARDGAAVRDIAGLAALERLEVFAPLGGNRR